MTPVTLTIFSTATDGKTNPPLCLEAANLAENGNDDIFNA